MCGIRVHLRGGMRGLEHESRILPLCPFLQDLTLGQIDEVATLGELLVEVGQTKSVL